MIKLNNQGYYDIEMRLNRKDLRNEIIINKEPVGAGIIDAINFNVRSTGKQPDGRDILKYELKLICKNADLMIMNPSIAEFKLDNGMLQYVFVGIDGKPIKKLNEVFNNILYKASCYDSLMAAAKENEVKENV